MAKTSGFMAEFKKFIMRGNVIDMAVGVIIAGAFGKITTSLVNDVFMPFIGWIIVGVLCCGIGTLWVYPYMQMARAHFYEERKAEFDPIVPHLSEDAPTE